MLLGLVLVKLMMSKLWRVGHEKTKQRMQLWERKRKIYHPASRERGADLMHGVWTQGLGGSSALEPILYYLPHYWYN